jgi:beta-glucosidase
MIYPKDFKFGVATCAAQVEGSGLDGGRSESIWDVFAKKPGAIANGATPGTGACDSYRLFDVDLWNMMDLGVNSYRMSIAWSRVMPDGVGRLNPQGVDYYKRCFEKLLKAGISPNVTLYHWDLPQVLENRGGWANRDSVKWFAEYADMRSFGRK